jgi:hypothetical protein
MRKIMLTAFLFCFIQAFAKTPVPDTLWDAKTAIVANEGATAKDFEKLGKLLKDWGRFELVQSESQADIVISLSTKIEYQTVRLPNTGGGLGGINSQQVFVSYLRILNRRDGSELWTDHTTNGSRDPGQLVRKLKNAMKKRTK